MNLPRASMTTSPFFGISALVSFTAVMWSPSIVMAEFGMILPVPGSIAVPLTMTVVPDGVARVVETRVAASARSRRRFICNRFLAGGGRNWKIDHEQAHLREARFGESLRTQRRHTHALENPDSLF